MRESTSNEPWTLYLDFDGVLNNDRFLRRQINLLAQSEHSLFDPNNINALNELCATLPVSAIVVTSSWREDRTVHQLSNLLSNAGFSASHLVRDVTPIGPSRVEEIASHRSLNDINKFIVLDDMSLSPMTRPHFFHVSPATGLTKSLCSEILRLLK